MPPQSQIAASGLVMFSGFYPPAMQVFTLSCIRHRRGFFIVQLNSKISRIQTLYFVPSYRKRLNNPIFFPKNLDKIYKIYTI